MKTEQFPDDFFSPPKSYYGDGAWVGEPDKLNWIDPESGLDCMIVRNKMGTLCGYVGVPESHPWFGVGYSGCINKHQPKTFEQKKAEAQKWFDDALVSHTEAPTGVTESALECARLALKPFLDPANYPIWVDMPRFDCLDWSKPEEERCKSPQDSINVHGGLTFADACHEGGHICHSPEVAANKKVWWFGFDCGHYMDYSPGLHLSLPWAKEQAMRVLDANPNDTKAGETLARMANDASGYKFYDKAAQLLAHEDEVYRDMLYVTNEVAGLAKQLKEQDHATEIELLKAKLNNGPGCRMVDGQVVCS